MSRFGAQKLVDFFHYFDRDNPNHVQAVYLLAQHLPEGQLSDDSAWVKVYRQRPTNGALRLEVSYLSQRDSTIPGQAHRMCFSSSCAMLVEALRPNALQGRDADDQYLRRLMGLGGDTTDAAAQLRALAHFGIPAQFSTGLGWEDLDRQLERGIPVPIGILHHGPVTAPAGGGHWITVIGRTANQEGYLVHDPYGELDLVAGGYLSANGAGLTYSRRNLGPRWMAEGPGSGWGILARRP